MSNKLLDALPEVELAFAMQIRKYLFLIFFHWRFYYIFHYFFVMIPWVHTTSHHTLSLRVTVIWQLFVV